MLVKLMQLLKLMKAQIFSKKYSLKSFRNFLITKAPLKKNQMCKKPKKFSNAKAYKASEKLRIWHKSNKDQKTFEKNF